MEKKGQLELVFEEEPDAFGGLVAYLKEEICAGNEPLAGADIESMDGITGLVELANVRAQMEIIKETAGEFNPSLLVQAEVALAEIRDMRTKPLSNKAKLRKFLRNASQLFLLFLTACAGQAEAQSIKAGETAIAKATAKMETATVIPEPSPTEVYLEQIVEEELEVEPIYQGPLTEAERAAVYESSMRVVANSYPEAIDQAYRLGVYHPSNMCGAIAGSFLIDAEIVKESRVFNKEKLLWETVPAQPVDFWELDPSPPKDEWKLNFWFPKDKFDRFYYNEPVGKFDYTEFPLYTGDFLYLFYSGASGRGTFPHIMTVSRVDEMGRAFSVTNLHIGEWPDGKGEFVIKEVMLYDPNNPGVGQFADYNNPEYMNKYGTTGFSFMVVRRK